MAGVTRRLTPVGSPAPVGSPLQACRRQAGVAFEIAGAAYPGNTAQRRYHGDQYEAPIKVPFDADGGEGVARQQRSSANWRAHETDAARNGVRSDVASARD